MKYLEKDILLETFSIDIAVLIFSLLSLFFSVITILIYIRVKSLRTIIYRLFFHIAINETFSRIAHIIHFINNLIQNSNENEKGGDKKNYEKIYEVIFNICAFLIYYTDTNILIFLTLSCYSMYELILKQNKTINNRLFSIVNVLYIISLLLTVFFFILPLFISKEAFNNELYKNIITLKFIEDKKINHKIWLPLSFTSLIYSFLVIYAFIKIILIQRFIKKRKNLNEIEEDPDSMDRKLHNKFKLKSFYDKMMQYPFLGLLFFIPIAAYSWIEFSLNDDDLYHLKIRFYSYNINCFINSIRGWMYFKVFISNEKIKIFLFKNFLTSSIFDSIDKILDIKKIRASFSSNRSSLSIENVKIEEKKANILEDKDEDYDERQLVEIEDNKDISFDNNNANKLYDDDEEDVNNISKESKSDSGYYRINKKIIN